MENLNRFSYQKVIIKIKSTTNITFNLNPLPKNNRKWIKIIDKFSKVEISRIRKKKECGEEITMDDVVFASQLIGAPVGCTFTIVKDIFPEVLILNTVYDL